MLICSEEELWIDGVNPFMYERAGWRKVRAERKGERCKMCA